MKHKILAFLFATLLPTFATFAQTAEEDSVSVSLLTCTPGDQIHRLYGHTALRIVTPQEDWAVNFGWFSFNTPNFVMKFILGLTDYSMAYQTMPIFITDLMRDDMGVSEQVLNLTPAEAAQVKKAMRHTLESEGFDRRDYTFRDPSSGSSTQETILGAHWTYRYNFLYDNCTTRAVDAIKEVLKTHGETLVFPAFGDAPTTQRMMIHEFTKNSPWFEFGQDLLLGPEVDEEHTTKELADGLNFLPTYAQNFFSQAQIRDKEGGLRPLVAETRNLTPFLMPKERHPAIPITPVVAFGFIAAVAIVISAFERKTTLKAKRIGAKTAEQRAWRIWAGAFDFTMWTLMGIVGILLVIMVGWSEHPAVGTNWLLLIFNPLFFLGIPARLMGGKFESAFAWFATIMGVATMLVDICGIQDLPTALIPIVLTVVIRAKVKGIRQTK